MAGLGELLDPLQDRADIGLHGLAGKLNHVQIAWE